MPRLMRGAARTAVIAGTATAVSGRVQRRQAEQFATRDAQIHAQREQAYEQQLAQQAPAAPAPSPAAPAASPGDDVVAKLQQLSDMHASGALSDDEFTAAKARLIGS